MSVAFIKDTGTLAAKTAVSCFLVTRFVACANPQVFIAQQVCLMLLDVITTSGIIYFCPSLKKRFDFRKEEEAFIKYAQPMFFIPLKNENKSFDELKKKFNQMESNDQKWITFLEIIKHKDAENIEDGLEKFINDNRIAALSWMKTKWEAIKPRAIQGRQIILKNLANFSGEVQYLPILSSLLDIIPSPEDAGQNSVILRFDCNAERDIKDLCNFKKVILIYKSLAFPFLSNMKFIFFSYPLFQSALRWRNISDISYASLGALFITSNLVSVVFSRLHQIYKNTPSFFSIPSPSV